MDLMTTCSHTQVVAHYGSFTLPAADSGTDSDLDFCPIQK